MFTLTSNATPSSASGFLEDVVSRRQIPWGPLRRIQPVHPLALRKFLLGYQRLSKAFTRHQQLFPEQPLTEYFGHMQHVRTHVYHPVPGMKDANSVGWWEVLGELVRRVEEQEWFEINWPALDDAWAWWQGDGEKEHEDDPGSHLAVFLEYIPLNMYGFNCQETMYEFPPVELFHALFSTKCTITNISASLLIDIEVYDEEWDEVWTPDDRTRAWALISDIESDSGAWSEPIRWLPEIIRWACHQTGNPILDTIFDPYKDGPWFLWEDFQDVSNSWQRARGVINAFQRLMTWYEKDNSRLSLLSGFLMEGEYSDDLDW